MFSSADPSSFRTGVERHPGFLHHYCYLILIIAFSLLPSPLLADGLDLTDSQQNVKKRLQERQREQAKRWRRFGDVEVDWDAWQSAPSDNEKPSQDIWITAWRRAVTRPDAIGSIHWPDHQPKKVDKNGIPSKALIVNCTDLTMTRRTSRGAWGEWRLPESDSEPERLVIEICGERS